MQQYINYINFIGNNNKDKVLGWIKSTLKNYLEKNNPSQDEVEHILDYLSSDKAPNQIAGMSYIEAKKNTDKWNKTLIKKGEHIKETEKDTEVVLDFKDGFKIVKLVGKSAYEREGYLMRHCVASYYGKSVDVYSLRDKDNMPHCTMEKDQQVKGKGNGDIHPKYVGYVVKFLEHIGMSVGDNEMKHLGYVNIEKLIPDIDDISKELFNGKYLPISKRGLIKVNGNPRMDLGMLDIFPLMEDTDESIKVAFDIPILVSASIEWIKKSISLSSKLKNIISETKIEAGGDSSQLAGGYSSQLAGGDYSKLAGGYYSKLAGGDSSQLAGGYSSQLAGGYSSQLAGGDSSQLAGGDSSQLAGGDYSKLAGGDSSQLAGGYSSQLAGGDYSKLAGGYYSKLAGGTNSVMVGGHKSKCKGGLYSVMTFIEIEEKLPFNIINFKAVQVDGKKIKADTWYEFKDGKVVEVKN